MKHKGAHSNIWIVDTRWRDDIAPLSVLLKDDSVISTQVWWTKPLGPIISILYYWPVNQ